MSRSFSKKSIATVALGIAGLSLFAASPAQATPALDCAVSASFTGYCVVQPGLTVTGELKGGNGGPGGVGGAGHGMGSDAGGLGGQGGVGGAGAQLSFSYTNTTSAPVTIQFVVGSNGTPGTAGIDSVVAGQPGLPGGDGTDGTATVIEDSNSTALFTANFGTAGIGGLGGLPADAFGPGADGNPGTAGTDGSGSTVSTTWLVAPFASITFVGVPAVDPEPTAPTLASTGVDEQQVIGFGALGAMFVAIGSLAVVARRRATAKK